MALLMQLRLCSLWKLAIRIKLELTELRIGEMGWDRGDLAPSRQNQGSIGGIRPPPGSIHSLAALLAGSPASSGSACVDPADDGEQATGLSEEGSLLIRGWVAPAGPHWPEHRPS